MENFLEMPSMRDNLHSISSRKNDEPRITDVAKRK